MVFRTSHVVALAACLLVIGRSYGQSAAMAQLAAHHTAKEIDDMRLNAHHRYIGEQLFYSSSFLVMDGVTERPATEWEIASVDLHAYDHLRLESERVSVVDTIIGHPIVLLCRNEFERLLLDNLNEEDRAAYQAHKSGFPVHGMHKQR